MIVPARAQTSVETIEVARRGGTASSAAGREVRERALELQLHPRKVARALLGLVVAIVVVGTVANLIIYHVAPHPEHALAKLMRRVDLGHEPSLPQWYSSLALFASALLLCVIAWAGRQVGAPYVSRWFALSLLFVGLAMDEAIQIHEMADTTLHDWLGTGGVLYFAWIIPGALFVLAVGGCFFGFLRQLDRRTRRLFLTAGAVFVAGAIGMEMLAGVIFDAAGSYEAGVRAIEHSFAQAIEELLEMLGVVLFIYALLDYLARHTGVIRVRLSG